MMDLLRDYAISFVGVPYIWGGNNRLSGMDCSGFIQELLKSVGADPPGDQTAQALFDHFQDQGDWNRFVCGSLAFFGTDSRHVSHVSMLLDHSRVIEAGGGDSSTTSLKRAKEQGACVRIRLLEERKNRVAIIRPHYVKIGLM